MLTLLTLRTCIPRYIHQATIRKASSKKGTYELIYDLPHVRVGSAVNAMKFKQTILTVGTIPISAAFEALNVIPQSMTAIFLTIAVGCNIAFYSVGHLFYKLIGKIYYNETMDTIKLSYVGFYGARVDIEVPREDVGAIGDGKPGLLYTKVYIHNDENLLLKISEKRFQFCHLEKVRDIFGQSFGR